MALPPERRTSWNSRSPRATLAGSAGTCNGSGTMGSCDSGRTPSALAADGSNTCCPWHSLAQMLTRHNTTARPPGHHRHVRNRLVFVCCVILLSHCSQHSFPGLLARVWCIVVLIRVVLHFVPTSYQKPLTGSGNVTRSASRSRAGQRTELIQPTSNPSVLLEIFLRFS